MRVESEVKLVMGTSDKVRRELKRLARERAKVVAAAKNDLRNR